ncbi:MAG: aldo/keto reductase [Clostridiales bacterium]|mgnify:CR=1 FL=1|nr:aldo/keto reductase [Clostridiales bacterium]
MKTIQLNQGIGIPQLGLGVFQTRDGEETANAVRWALEAEYRHIDTARIYGNEAGVGQGIRASGVPREEIFLTTKLWNEDIRRGRAREAFAESLAALGTDYVDLYLIHWPVQGFEQAWNHMEELHKAGKIRAIGVSNFHSHHLDSLEKTARIQPAVNQIESHPYFNNQELIDECHRRGIAVQVWSPLGGTGGTLLKDPLLQELAQKYGRTPAQIVLRWDIQRNVIVLPKSTHRDRIFSNRDMFDFELSGEDMERIRGLQRNRRVGPDPDHFNF